MDNYPYILCPYNLWMSTKKAPMQGPIGRFTAWEVESRPVSRVLSPPTRKSEGGDHSSRTAVADGLERSTRRSSGAGRAIPPYVNFLPVGFTLPRLSPGAR